MSGNRTGGLKARDTNKTKYGADFYAKIGAKGGKNGKTGGFYASKVTGKNWHIEAGRLGGTISRKVKP